MFPWYREITPTERRTFWSCFGGWGLDALDVQMFSIAIPALIVAFGPARLLWGSDWPHTQFEHAEEYSDARAQLDRWIADPVARRAVLETTPAALFRFQSAADSARGSPPTHLPSLR